MSIDELIAQLESAIALGDSDEEWTAGDFDVHAGKWKRATGNFKGTAQAIAIRHNTAAMVLSELKTQRARADLAEARANELYGCLREAEDIGVEDSMFDEDERRTGPSGWDVDNERRWIESTKDHTP